jgi:hypothetical protein
VLPYHTKDDYKPKKGPLKSYLNQSGIYLQQITNDNTAQTETWIAVNPTNPKNAIATANDFSGSGGSGDQWRMVSHATFDGGESWRRRLTDNHNKPYIIPKSPNQGATIFDPIITYNNDGEALYVYGYTMTSGSPETSGIFMSISDNGGESWRQWNEGVEVPIIAYSTAGLQDRYHTYVDRTGGQYDGRLYVAWRDFATYNGIRVAYADQDEYVSQIWKSTGIINNAGTQAPFPVVGIDGTVWLSFRLTAASDKTSAPIYISTNGGESFNTHSTPLTNWNIGVPSSEVGGGRVSLINKDGMRISTNPQLAVDHSQGEYRGSLYCVMPGKAGGLDGPNKIYLATLRNANPDSKPSEWDVKTIDNSPNGNDMFFPSITVDPITGYIHVFYYSSQDDPANIKVDGYYAYSYDGGNTWKHRRLTDESMSVRATSQEGFGNRYWGDYASIDAYDNHIYPLFWIQETEGNFRSNELYTARIRTYPDKPEIIESIYSGGSVNISWSGIFDGLGEPISDYSVKLYKNGNELTEIEGTDSYSDSDVNIGDEVTYGIQVISKDVRGEGDIYNFTVNVGGKLETLQPTNFVAKPAEGGMMISFDAPSETVDGQPVETIDKINVYSEGNLIATVENENILAGETNELLVVVEENLFLEDIRISTVRVREDMEEESVLSNSSICFTGAPVANLNESFENSDNILPFTTDGNWGVTEEGASEGNFSFTDSPNENYATTQSSYVIFKPAIVTSDNPQIVLDAVINVLDGGDYAQFETSNDFGKTWFTHLATSDAYFDGWTGDINTSTWLPIPLYALADGQQSDTVYTRVRIVSTKIISGEGIFLDNIRPDNIASVESTNQLTDLIVYPNPVEKDFNVGFVVAENDFVTPKLYDIQGNLILEYDRRFLNSGYQEIKLSSEKLNTGVYYLLLESKNSNVMAPISVSK